ncbi:MAG TPA: hypothetical protein VGL74_03180 [Terriglobales bacterium]|jgi:hypothetical protein
MRKFGFLVLIAGLFTVSAFAADSDALPANALRGMHLKHTHPSPSNFKKKGNIPTPHGFPLGVDTITNFTGHFESQGVYFDGSAHHTWEYSMVGNPPEKGGTTWFNAPIVPVSMDLRNADGSVRYVIVIGGLVETCGIDVPMQAGCQRLFSDVTPFIQPFVQGPVFSNASFSSSSVPTQVTDAVQKAEFGNKARPDWHTLLAPSIKATRTMVLNRGTYQFALNADGSCCAYILVLDPVFGSKLFPPVAPDNSTVIGSAEVAGDITTKDISTFMFPNVYLFETDGSCCVLGFHSFDFEAGDASNGNELRFYIVNYSSWISPGIFADPTCSTTDPENCFQDVTANSHEVAETFNDPFVGFDGIHNITPFWQNPAGQCQDLLETGDVIEDLLNPTYPVTINGFSYHPQTEALLPWFEFQKNSTAIDNAYSYPNETALTALSAPQPLNCGE